MIIHYLSEEEMKELTGHYYDLENEISSANDIIRFRLDEVDPFLDEVERQFKIYSRLISANQFELDLTK